MYSITVWKFCNISVEFSKRYWIALTNLIFTLFSNKTIHPKTLAAKKQKSRKQNLRLRRNYPLGGNYINIQVAKRQIKDQPYYLIK
jgi:hypothetical protein